MRHDIIIVGGGAVGLHAAHKAAVLNQEAVVVDKGRSFSRVTQAERIANIPLAPGISGDVLLDRLRTSIESFQSMAQRRLVTFLEETEAVEAERDAEGFRVKVRDAHGQEQVLLGRVLVLATGVVDRKPGIHEYRQRGHATLLPFVHGGEVGYCLLCEGWSLGGRRVAVIGHSEASATIAKDVQAHFEGHVTLLTDGQATLDEVTEVLNGTKVRVVGEPVEQVHDEQGQLVVEFGNGKRETFDKAFFSLGWYKVNNELAVMLGAKTTPQGCVVTDDNCEVLDAQGRPIRGLFAVGDLRAGSWKQVVVGWGDAETAIITAYAYRLPE